VELTTDEGEEEDQTLVSDESGIQEIIAPDYQLARDRESREINPPKRYDYADLICYAMIAVQEVQDLEPNNFREALESKDWLKSMNEEILSLEKTHT